MEQKIFKFCSQCGEKISQNQKFCMNCGSANLGYSGQDASSQSTKNQANENYEYSKQEYGDSFERNMDSNYYGTSNTQDIDIRVEEMKKYVGKKVEYYLPKFNEMKYYNKKYDKFSIVLSDKILPNPIILQDKINYYNILKGNFNVAWIKFQTG